MVGQLRTYTINKGMMESWLKLFHEVIAPKTLEFGMGIQSAWTDEENERFIWISYNTRSFRVRNKFN